MLSPNPLSLLCALLLCLPLALVFTITAPPTPASTTAAAASSSTTSIVYATKNNQTINLQEEPRLLPNYSQSFINYNSNAAAAVSPPAPPIRPTRKPPHLQELDDPDDDALMQLAARVNLHPKPPTKKKLAFLFLTTTPLPFAPLWEAFFNNTPKSLYNIYIHADPTYNYTPPFRGVFARRVIPSKPTRRHSPTLASAARRLLARALLHDRSNYMFALLSQSCIPLHSFSFTYRTLARSKRSFIEILGDEPGAYDRWAARGEEVMLPEVKFEDFRIGSQFFVLKRKHARMVVRDRRLWTKFKLPCSTPYTCYPEEHYFPTLLNMVDPSGCVPATLTHVDWSGSQDGHPRMYNSTEVGPELIWALRRDRPRYGDEEANGSDWEVAKRRDPFVFARKFSAESIEALMEIAKEVIFKD